MHFREKVEVILHNGYGITKRCAAVVATPQLYQHGVTQVHRTNPRRVKKLHLFQHFVYLTRGHIGITGYGYIVGQGRG